MNNIKKYIDLSGKTMKQISQDTGINYTTLTNYYRGERMPRDTKTWTILADYFQIPAHFLMGFDDFSEKEVKQNSLEKAERKLAAIQSIMDIDTEHFTPTANLYRQLSELVAVGLPEDHHDFFWINSLVEKVLIFSILYSKQRVYSEKAMQLDLKEREKLEKQLFGTMSQKNVNDIQRELASQIGANFP
jgi:transcriptional regulator with XRE-family HTH domain